MEQDRNLCVTCKYNGDCPIQPEAVVVAQCHLINPRDEFITSPIEDFSYLFTKKPPTIKP